MPLNPCFYPTTVVFLDDHKYFFDDIASQLSTSRTLYQDFICPLLFLEYLSQTPSNRFVREYVTLGNLNTYHNHYGQNANIHDLRHIAYDPLRFQEVSVVVLDYNMPTMNGLEVAQQIKNPHIKKILLTSVADEHVAIEAFHKGLIDAYIRKQTQDSFIDQLNAHIYRLQKAYFADVFSPLTQTLQTYSEEMEAYPFFQSAYESLREDYIQRYNIIEYYLCEGTGTSLMIDDQQNVYGFFCRNDGDYQMMCDALPSASLPASLQNKLKAKKLILCYDPQDYVKSMPHNWQPLLKKAATNTQGFEFQYAFEKGLLHMDLEKFTPFEQQAHRLNDGYKQQALTL